MRKIFFRLGCMRVIGVSLICPSGQSLGERIVLNLMALCLLHCAHLMADVLLMGVMLLMLLGC